MADREYPEKRPGFIDASYVAHDDAPNMPRCFSYTDDKNGGKTGGSPWAVAGLCIALFVLCSFINATCTSLYTGRDSELDAPETQRKTSLITTGVMAAAASQADTPPAAASGTGASEDRPYLGVIVQTVSCAAAEYYNSSNESCMVPGVQVYALDTDGPAACAGLRCGDIIIRLDEHAVATAADLTELENALAPGSDAVLTVYRAGEYRELPVVFSACPADASGDDGWYDIDNAW